MIPPVVSKKIGGKNNNLMSKQTLTDNVMEKKRYLSSFSRRISRDEIHVTSDPGLTEIENLSMRAPNKPTHYIVDYTHNHIIVQEVLSRG